MLKNVMQISIVMLFFVTSVMVAFGGGADLNQPLEIHGVGGDQTSDVSITSHKRFTLIDDYSSSPGYYDYISIASSVMDEAGSTYVLLNIEADTLVLGSHWINLNTQLGRSTYTPSMVVAKLDHLGNWVWVYAPEPKDASECNNGATNSLNWTESKMNDIDISDDGSQVIIVGSFQGCYMLTPIRKVYNPASIDAGLAISLNTTTGDLNWAFEMLPFEMDPSQGHILLKSVDVANVGGQEKVFMAGQIATVSLNMGGNIARGDTDGDALFVVLSSNGSYLHHKDSCAANDVSAGYCNAFGNERGVEVLYYSGKVFFGMHVENSFNETQVFDSTTGISNSGYTLHPVGWMFNAQNYSSLLEQPFDFGVDNTRVHNIVEAAVNEQDELLVLFNSAGSTDEPGVQLVNQDKNEVIKFVPDDGLAWAVRTDGFIRGDNLQPKISLRWGYSLDRDVHILNESDTEIGLLTLSTGADILELSNFTLNSVPLAFSGYDRMVISNGATDSSIIGLDSTQGYEYALILLEHDADMDGIPDRIDPFAFLPASQDTDGDSISNSVDNCPTYWNQEQRDTDGDGIGDECDRDLDGDGIFNNNPYDYQGVDQCPFENASLSDADGDGCLDDSDGDGIPDLLDFTPNLASDEDYDSDTIANRFDNCIYVANTYQLDLDQDAIGDACDDDIDGDGVNNTSPFNGTGTDLCPYENASSFDLNGDGCLDEIILETDVDGDGIPNTSDVCPGFDDGIDVDGDGIADGCDEFPLDTDNDGISNSTDNCVFVQNTLQTDLDGDGIGDVCDNDLDGDGVNNSLPVDLYNNSNHDLCPYVNASIGNDVDNDGCLDDPEVETCEVCNEQTEDQSPKKDNTTEILGFELDEEELQTVETVATVGGTGAVGGGLVLFGANKLRQGSKYLGVDDGIDILRHLPKTKKKDDNSDHYFKRGLIRQREMTKSADSRFDEYVEFDVDDTADIESQIDNESKEASE